MNIAARRSADDRPSVIALAVSHLKRNELARAQALLTHALARSPHDPAFLHLLGTVSRLEHKPAQAEEFYRRSLASMAAQPHVHRDLGKLFASLGRLDEAIAEFGEALRLKADDTDAHLCLATALARRGEYASAEAAYRRLLRLQPGHIVARLGLAEALCYLRRARDAELVLRQAQAVREPALAAAVAYRLGLALKHQKKYSQALALFDAAQAHQPDFPAIDFIRGETYQQMGSWDEAALCFRKVLARNPRHANAAGCLALIAALTGDFMEARDWAMKVLSRAPAHELAHVALALAEIEDEDFAAAADRLRRLFENPESKAEGTAVVTGFAADAFDRRGRYPESFAVARASKEMLRNIWPVHDGATRVTDTARALANYFDASEPWKERDCSTTTGGEPSRHVFVLGFLRSGTTLIETILAGAPDVVHADEVDFLAGAANKFPGRRESLDQLAALPDADIAQWRENYWKAVHEAQFEASGKLFIDKMPINTFRLPLIARLFPEAKIVFAIRDPRDVVLSCFRRHFDRTPYSMEFLDLETCARFYAATMALADSCRKKLPLDIVDLRYEDIVADFDTNIGQLCRFVGVDWSESMRDFRRSAGNIDLRSASARQVRRGLYTGAVGHWRRYREELAPVLPILTPWATRFGYPSE